MPLYPDKTHAWNDAKTIIKADLEKITWALQKQSPPTVHRMEVKIQGIDLLKWLAAQDSDRKIYFSGRDKQDKETACIGSADAVRFDPSKNCHDTFKHMRSNLSAGLPELKYYGGFAFTPDHIDDDWRSFGVCHFTLPRFELSASPSGFFLACNVVEANETQESLATIVKELEELEFSVLPEFSVPGAFHNRVNTPAHDEWVTNLTGEIAAIKAGEYQKTVLARKVLLEFETAPDPVALLAKLKELPTRRYDFLFQLGNGKTFLGSSPERLFKREGRQLVSEALAGTRTRGKLEAEDRELADELMSSDKEQMEHDFVQKTIINQLEPLCESLETDAEKHVLKLKEVQHIISGIRGVLKRDVSDHQLVQTLHPTPAVGGCPLDKALAAIDRSEPFKRGWYAGAIGVVGYDSADFAVGLRSGMTEGKSLKLYSGLGVVEGSDPESEWLELESKLINFLNIFSY